MKKNTLEEFILINSAEYTILKDLISEFLAIYPDHSSDEAIKKLKPIIITLLKKGTISIKSFRDLDYANAHTLPFREAIDILEDSTNWQNLGKNKVLYFLYDEEY